MKKIYFLALTLFAAMAVWSQGTYTWVGNNNASWQTSSNWSPARTSINSMDTLLFSAGNTRTITNVPDQTVGRIRVFNNTTISLSGASGTPTLVIANGSGDDLIVANGSTLTFNSSLDDVTLASSATANIGGTLIIANLNALTLNSSANVTVPVGGVLRVNSDLILSGTGATATVNGTLDLNGGTLNLGGNSVVATINGILDNSGSISSASTQKLVFPGGGKYQHTQNGGSIPVAAWNASSTCEITGITSTVPNNLGQSFGNFTWNCTSQTSDISFAAELETVNGDFRVGSTGSGSIRLKNSGGSTTTTTVGGDYIQTGGTLYIIGTSQTQELEIKGNFNMSGGTLTRNGGTGNFNFIGTSEQTFTKTGGTISSSVNFAITSGAIVNFGTSVLNGTGPTFNLNSGGKIITANNGGIPATITVTGTKTFSSGADYEFRGSSTGSFTTSTANTVRDLIINNTTGNVTLSMPIAVTRTLVMTDGELNTDNTNLVTVNDNATVTGASNSSFVNGPVRKIGNDSFTFPVGRNGSGYVPVAIIDNNSGASNTFIAEYFRAVPPNNTNISGTAGVNHISYCDYWSVNRTVTGDVIDVQFSWNGNSACSGAAFITDPASVRVVHYNGSQWDLSSPGGGTGTASAGTATWMSLNNFSLFALGSTSGSSNPLPVLFDNVKAFTKNGGVQIEWSNLTERDLNKYVIERSANGRDFSAVTEVTPKINTNDRADYIEFDASPLQGVNFYRIKVLEINGKIIFSKTLRVETSITKQGFTLYPNPVTGGQLTLALTGIRQGQYSVRVVNGTGQNVFSKTIVSQAAGITQTIQLPSAIKPGVYTILVNGDDYQQSQLFIVQ